MTTIFISHTQEDVQCAEHIRQSLEVQGYTPWREPASLTIESVLYPRTLENVILGSAAFVLIWSSSAAQSAWVERQLLFAQQLKKLIVPVLLDSTALPATLIVRTTITGQPPCVDAVAQLVPQLPLPGSTDPLMVLSEKASHEFIRIRKEAIEQAADMLKRDEHREAVLAILEYLVQNDLITGVREKAQEVLDTDAKKAGPSRPIIRPEDSRHMIGVRCKQCGHITYFDKRTICSAQSQVVRYVTLRAGKTFDEMELPCENCSHSIPAHIDCEGYK